MMKRERVSADAVNYADSVMAERAAGILYERQRLPLG
jgi:hypothetical protein